MKRSLSESCADHVWLFENTNARHRFLVFGNDIRVPQQWLARYGKLVERAVFYFLEDNGQLVELAEHLGHLNDPRDNRGKVYPLGIVLSMIVLARLSGQDKPKGIFEWLRHRREAFSQVNGLKVARTPCLNTIRTILSGVVNLDEIEKRLRSYLHERS